MEGIYVIISALIGAAATITSVLISKRSRMKYDPILNETQNNENIYAALSFLMQEMKADRAYVFQFHNGGYYVSGRSQQKFSCTHEITEPGIIKECQDSQNHIVSNFHTYINQLILDKKFAYTDCSDVEDHVFSSLMQNKGIRSIYNVPIVTLNNKVIGILGVDYIKDRASKDCTGFCPQDAINDFGDKTHEFMRRQARVIAGYLI